MHPDDVGPLAYARLLRDGALAVAIRGTARPRDIPDSPGLRAIVAAPRVPAHTVLTGLAALWTHGWLPAPPSTWHAVGARGLYRPAGCLVELHSGRTATHAVRIGPLRVAAPARACLDALRWEPPEPALRAVGAGLASGRIRTRTLLVELEREAPTGAGYVRLVSLVQALRGAWPP